MTIFIYENQIYQYLNLNIHSGYFFFELFFYSTYDSIGVLVPLLILNKKPFNLILSSIYRTQKYEKEINYSPSSQQVIKIDFDKKNEKIEEFDFETNILINNALNFHPTGRILLICPTPKYLLVCNELLEFQCVLIKNTILQFAMDISQNNINRIITLSKKINSFNLLFYISLMLIVSHFY